MSMSSQGPGWWLASDGRWYPPEQGAGSRQVIAPPVPVYGPQSATTSGMAVASLVLSIIWIGGLGSLAAIVLGFVAKGNIRQSAGTKTGGGLAIAGIIIGFVGLAGLALIIVIAAYLGNAANNLANDLRPINVAFGTTVNVSNGVNPGIKSVTVYSLTAAPSSQTSGAPAHDTVSAARVTICADSSGAQQGFDVLFMSAFFADGQSATSDGSATVRGMGRNLTAINRLAPNQCLTGYVPFDVVAGSRPVGVEYLSNIFRTVHWRG